MFLSKLLFLTKNNKFLSYIVNEYMEDKKKFLPYIIEEKRERFIKDYYFKSIKQHRRGRGIWIKAVKKETHNIAQNKSFVQKEIEEKHIYQKSSYLASF